jgi:hypothetical protein
VRDGLDLVIAFAPFAGRMRCAHRRLVFVRDWIDLTDGPIRRLCVNDPLVAALDARRVAVG